MARIFFAFLGLLLGIAPPSLAETPDRSIECVQQASHLGAQDREAFLRACLSEDARKMNRPSPREKMRECTQQAEGKTGEERRQFMNSCLKR